MHPRDELVPLLKKLRLSGVLDTLDLRVQEAVGDEVPHTEFLVRLLRDEVERRNAKQLTTRLRRANFEHAKTLGDFDFSFNPSLPKVRITELCAGGFIGRRENVLLLGQTGVGKSHIAQAIGHRACLLGHSVLFVAAHDLFRELRQARADDSVQRRLQKYLNVDLLILDDLGLRPLEHSDPVDLYDLIRGRYERGSLVVTSNRDVDELMALFPDALLGNAAVDRLLHHARILRLTGRSYRRDNGVTADA
ncbi:MAG: ATP-binding protein [bacterium]|nr:ATP-binding protein [bacterium]